MGKYLKIDSPPEKALQEVEDLMRKKGISITSLGGNGFAFSFEGLAGEYWLQSKESGERSTDFPRVFDDERLAAWE